jgi:hypothetical protein
MNIDVKLGQKVWVVHVDEGDIESNKEIYEITETSIARINISISEEDFQSSADWCRGYNFVETEDSVFFNLETDNNENFTVVQQNEEFYLAFSKEEAGKWIAEREEDEENAEREKELAELKRLQEKYPEGK